MLAIKLFVAKPVWGMIQFMLYRGCRPFECCAMRWSEIDTSKAVWTYCPKPHKTVHKGKKRLIVIGPQGQQILNSLRELSRSNYVFDPQAEPEKFIRKTSRKIAKVRNTVEARYSKHSLNAAVRKACEKAKKKKLITVSWSPGQLRKTRATNARQQSDLETAQQVLGHSSKQTTERHYAEVDLSRAEANALQFG